MVRKLSLAIAIALGVTSVGIHALGLGKIKSNSALNQTFDASIELLSLDEEEIADINISLASVEAFQQADIERPYFLSHLSFKPVLLPNGTAIVQVTSRDPIREPFLNFLVEMNWPKGRIQREYTVLLDPPTTLETAPAPVRKPSAAMARPVSRDAVGADTSYAAPGEARIVAGEYGPTRRNDTLWGIATRVRHQGTTIEQTVIALFQANQSAFIKRNINNLKIGRILRVPSREEVLALGAREARAEFRNQMNDWRAGRDVVPAPQVESEPPIQEAMEEATVTEGAPESVVPEAELKIVTPTPAEDGEAGPEEVEQEPGEIVAKLQEELIVAQEEKESALAEGDELHSRLEDLESQLDDLQRLLTLKDDQLARLQAALLTDEAVEEPDVATVAEETIEVPLEESEQEIAGTTESEDVTIISEEESGPESTGEAVIDEAAIDEVVIDEADEVVMETTEEPQIEPAAVVEPEPAEPLPAAPAKTGMQNLVQRLMADTTLLIGMAVGVVVILLSLMWIAISRRRTGQDEFQESILVDTIDSSDVESAEDSSESNSHTTEETSFLSDFSPSDVNALQDETGEVDPVAEADVYIAYGRYKQAEILIREALENDPGRPELRQKLFEILHSTKDADGFMELAEAAAAEGMDQKDPAGWEKVVAMGAQLAPGAALFSAANRPLSADEDDDGISALQEELGQIGDFDLNDMTADLEEEKTDQESDIDLDSFDLDKLEDLEELAGLEGDEGPATADPGLDFDLDLGQVDEPDTLLGDLDKAAEPASEEPDKPALPDLDEGVLDFSSLDDLGENRSAETGIEIAPAGGLEALSLEADGAEELDDTVINLDVAGSGLDDYNFDSLDAGEGEESLQLTADEEITKLDLPELDIASDEPAMDMTTPPTDDGFDVDEVNTKLDLARAYVDMGDAEGARDILNEVLEEGNDGQKGEAQEMLNGII